MRSMPPLEIATMSLVAGASMSGFKALPATFTQVKGIKESLDSRFPDLAPDLADRVLLKGPIPAKWLKAAARCKKRDALRIGIVLWIEKELTGDRIVSPSNYLLEEFGIDSKWEDRGLKELQEAGLIEVLNNDPYAIGIFVDGPKSEAELSANEAENAKAERGQEVSNA